MRDMQRKRVYRAEALTAFVLESEHGFEFGWGSAPMSPAECQTNIDSVCNSPWLRERYGTHQVTIRFSPLLTHGRANPRTKTITVGGKCAFSMTARYLLHELAHVIEPANDEPSHGPIFCATYIDLVEHFLGKLTADVLTAQMKALKIRVKPKATRAKRNLTPEQRAAAAERAAYAREVRSQKALLKRAEAEHARRLQVYSRYWRMSQSDDLNPPTRDWAARKAEQAREDTNRLWERIGTVKYHLAKQQQANRAGR